MPSTLVNSIGLILDIIGALLLIKFGIPPKIDREGHMHLVLEQVDQDEIEKAGAFDRWSTFAIWLIVAGFALQLVSNYI